MKFSTLFLPLLAVVLLLQGFGSAAPASSGDTAEVSIRLPAAATSSGLDIKVSDIAEVSGADAATVARVSAASLGYAPAPGYSRTLRADLVQASLRQALPGVAIAVEGAPRCRVTPSVRTLRGVDLRAYAAEKLRDSLRGVDADTKPTGTVADVLFPEGEFEPRLVAVPDTGAVLPGRRNVQIQIWLGEQLYRTVHVPFQLDVWQRSAVLRSAVDVGQRLHAGLFEIKRVPIDEAGGLQALAMDELGGAVALKPLPAGTYVTERQVHREVVIAKGDTVTVRVRKGAVEVSDVAVAQMDGRTGERVRVTLRSTGRELIGVVRGRQLVEVVVGQ